MLRLAARSRTLSVRASFFTLASTLACTLTACGGSASNATNVDAAPSLDGGADSGADVAEGDVDAPYCAPPIAANEIIRFAPTQVILAPGESRKVRAYIEPDVCGPTPIAITSNAPATATVDGTFVADRNVAETYLEVTGVAVGSTTITSTFGTSTAAINVDVVASDPVACTGTSSGSLAPGGNVALSSASIALASGASKANTPDNSGHVDPFDVTVSCGADMSNSGVIALGPAITFAPVETRVLRMLTYELPINPALMPATANLKHIQVLYSSTSLPTPRAVPVSNMQIVASSSGTGWVLQFGAPRLGTYQAVVPAAAGSTSRTRHLTHRAVVGFSMGGIGASLMGMNHHDLFDVVAPLGGPLDAAWFLWYFKTYHFGGFCPTTPGALPTTPCHADVGPPTETYEHVQDFEHWWHMNNVQGTGGTFARSSYIQIFRDVSSMWGDPLSSNDNPEYPYVANGITMPEPFTVTSGADYCNDPTKSTVAVTGYYDSKYNPDGSLPVIRFCDGANDPSNAGTWTTGGDNPMEVALAVDLNGNGTRDEGEPVLVQGSEPWDDFGTDKTADVNEPGYDAVNNPDPAGDDYDPEYNPSGTENNRRYDTGETFQDVGLDGMPCPVGATCPYDVGEGDGKFTLSIGAQTFYARDGRSQLEGYSAAPVGGVWDDDALNRIDYFSDGGVRDIFNWGDAGHHFISGFQTRGRNVAYFDDWTSYPNDPVSDSENFDPKQVDFSQLPQSVFTRYGSLDASESDIALGDGQHVGTASQLLRRVQGALYFIGSRWPDADRAYIEDPDGTTANSGDCTLGNSCTIQFTDHLGRTGPTTIILPPGYHADAAQSLTYPVTFFLHGYGQSPEDLLPTVLLVTPYMGSGLSSQATRLQKMILVFVDGRCRLGPDGVQECINGQFYTNSVRPGGPQIDDYFIDLMTYMDANYRTMAPSDVQVGD